MRILRWTLALMLAAGTPAAGATASSATASSDELWRGPAGEACQLLLINEIGGVRVGAGPPGATAAVAGAPELMVGVKAQEGQTTLMVARRADAGDTAPGDTTSSDVELSVPPECRVAVRTKDGFVTAEIGPAAFQLMVKTVTGAITARVDPAATATVVLATSGEITTDYTIEIDFRYHQEPAKHGRVAIGSEAMGEATGAPTRIHLRSRRGAVSVLRPAEVSGRP